MTVASGSRKPKVQKSARSSVRAARIARQFITNERGERTAVVLSIAEYEALLEKLEDLEDQKLAAERVGRNDTVAWEDIKRDLKAQGRLRR